MKKIVVAVMLSMIICFFMAGCGSGNEGEDSAADVIGTCTIAVQDQLKATAFDINEGDTVYDILRKTDLPVATDDTGNGLAIEAIGGVASGDKGKASGWMYSVNGEVPMDYCDKLAVNDGDEIVWEFSEGM